jgi:acetylornithine deacetylase/succinyl-diaminopimelate desuccinylase-like protein
MHELMDKSIYLDYLKHFLQIQSISTQTSYAKDMQEARHFLLDTFKDMGFATRILKAKKHDAVFAQKIVDPKLPTVLIYGHYDVQPPDPIDDWDHFPFEPKVVKNAIFARGATDNKGQIMVHIMAVKTLLEEDKKLPINFKFIIEGEEEIGSISVSEIARKYAKDLLKCDYIMVSDSEMLSKSQPAIDISLRGLVYTEIRIDTSKHDLHSGQFGGVAANPAQILSEIIAKLKDSEGRIKIPKFYDHVLPPTKEELKDYSLAKITNDQLKKEGGLYALGGGEDWYSLNERRWSRPTLDVNGMVSGYIEEGSKTIIPASASAKISMRLVPNQDPKLIFEQFAKYVKSLTPKGVKITIKNYADALPYKSPTTDPVFAKVKLAMKKSFGKTPIFQGVGGSIGFIPVLANALQVPSIMIGFGLPDDNLHAPNEHFDLGNYYKGIAAMVDLYTHLKDEQLS